MELAENFPTHDLDLERGNMMARIISLAQDCLRDQVGVTPTESQQQIELGKRMRGKERVRRKGMGKRRKGIDPMEDYGGSEDESQFGPVLEVDQLHLPLTHHGNSVYDGTHMYDPVTKVDDMELCDEIPQLPESQDMNKIDGSSSLDVVGTSNAMTGEESLGEMPESYDVKREDRESKVDENDAAKEISEENVNREEEDGIDMGGNVGESSSLGRRGENSVVA